MPEVRGGGGGGGTGAALPAGRGERSSGAVPAAPASRPPLGGLSPPPRPSAALGEGRRLCSLRASAPEERCSPRGHRRDVAPRGPRAPPSPRPAPLSPRRLSPRPRLRAAGPGCSPLAAPRRAHRGPFNVSLQISPTPFVAFSLPVPLKARSCRGHGAMLAVVRQLWLAGTDVQQTLFYSARGRIFSFFPSLSLSFFFSPFPSQFITPSIYNYSRCCCVFKAA